MWQVLQVRASDLRKLCRCAADAPPLHALDSRLGAALSMAYHYCDTTDNPYFVGCKALRRQGCRKHPVYLMNVSRGMQRPARVPHEGCAAGRGCGEYHFPAGHITEGVVGSGQWSH